MGWLRLEDTISGHHKMLRAGPTACWLWVCALAYAQRHLTDGFIPDSAVPHLGLPWTWKPRYQAGILVREGLLERVDKGYQIHDYHDYNATAEEAAAHRAQVSAKRAVAGKLGGIRSAIARRQAKKQKSSNTPKQNEAPSRPDLKPPYSPPFQGGRRPTRDELKQAREIRRIRFGRCPHDPPCRNHVECVMATVAEVRDKAVSA